MKKYSIDIHAHCTLKPYNTNYPGLPVSLWNKFTNSCDLPSDNVWSIIEPAVLRGTQCAFEQAAAGQVKIVGVSLMTYESGWVRTHPVKRSLLSCLTGISMPKLKFIKDDRLDHQIYTDITDEFKYLANEVDKTYTDSNGVVWKICFLTRQVLQDIYNGTIDLDAENIIYVFVNIEGVQSLGIDSVQSISDESELPDPKKTEITTRINEIKNTWSSIPQYVTFCHHFGNRLAGHARTIPPMLAWLGVDQSPFMDIGLTNNGKKVVRELLCDEQRQIIVDIKHFSAQSRKDYYQYLQELKTEFPHLDFPIICSHTGIMNRYETLDELVAHKDSKNDLKNEYLLNWSINMCREDLEMILASGGLVGVQIDLKRLIGDKYKDRMSAISKSDHDARKDLSCEIVWANIFTAVALLNTREAWDILSIGSDYDGIVSFLPEFSTMSAYADLKQHMLKVLQEKRFTSLRYIKVNDKFLSKKEVTRLMFGLTAEEILDKVFSMNAVAFWKDHFVDQVLPPAGLIP